MTKNPRFYAAGFKLSGKPQKQKEEVFDPLFLFLMVRQIGFEPMALLLRPVSGLLQPPVTLSIKAPSIYKPLASARPPVETCRVDPECTSSWIAFPLQDLIT